jgi:hypothetical protein
MRPAIFIVGLALATPSAAQQTEPTEPLRPNIVFIVTDDQRWGTIDATHSPFGTDIMPFVRSELMDSGVVFTQAFMTTPLCSPSRASMFTGQYAHRHGIYSVRGSYGPLAFDDTSTAAVWLQDAGYRTGLYGKYMNDYHLMWTPPEPPYVAPGWDEWHAIKADPVERKYYYDYKLIENGVEVLYGATEADSVYEESLRSPLVVRYPALAPTPRTQEELVLNIDLAPTFAELAGAVPGPATDGQSLVPLIAGTAPEWRFDFMVESYKSGQQFAAVREADWKYVEFLNGDTELYDLANDPLELDSVAGAPQHAARTAAMAARLREIRPGWPGDAECPTLADGSPCSDNNACTSNEECLDGACVSGAPPPDCDDGNACTDDSCSPTAACVHAPAFVARVNDTVHVSRTEGATIISWTDAPGPFNVYRGSRITVDPWDCNQECRGSDLSGTSVVESEEPPAATLFYYLVSRTCNPAESALGQDSDGNPTPQPFDCPLP